MFKGNGLAGGNAVDDELRAALTPALAQGQQLLLLQVVEVGHIVYQPCVEQGFHGFPAQAADVHGLAADKVFDAPRDLRRAAMLVGAVVLRLVLIAHQGGAAGRAVRGVMDGPCVCGPSGKVHCGDLGNDLAAFFHLHQVAEVQVQLGDLVGIVDAGPFHGGAGQFHGIQYCNGGYGTGAPHEEFHAQELGELLLGGEFVGNGPARAFCAQAQLLLQGDAVHFDHHPVDADLQVVAFAVPVGNKLHDALHRVRLRDEPPLGIGRAEAPRMALHDVAILALRGQFRGVQRVDEVLEVALGHQFGVLQFQGSRSGVAGVGEHVLTHPFALAVQCLKLLSAHEDLAAGFQLGRRVSVQAQGDGSHGADVGRDVLALFAVAPGKALHQLAVPVGEADGHPVVLQLHGEEGAAMGAGDALHELLHLLAAVAVAEREHGPAVGHGGEFLGDVTADALGGAVCRGQAGPLLFEGLQFLHHEVELLVGDLRLGLHVVQAVVPLQVLA